MTDLVVSFGTVNPAIITAVRRLSWPAFAAWLTAEPPIVADKAARGWYIPVEFSPAYRDSDNFVARYALTFDFDVVPAGLRETVEKAWSDLAYAIYPTFSHTPAKPRFRVVMPLARPLGYDEFQAVVRKVAVDVGIEHVARESFVPSQMMYAPSRRSPTKWDARVNEGLILDPDVVLAEYADWTDRTSWPHRAEGDGVHAKAETQTPPNEKPGIVGEFCRAFDVPAAIARFGLPYEPTATEGRWTYTAGSRPEGAILYDGGQKLHSHHDTDPARGQSNAFDLVRAHRFAGLDNEKDKLLPINERHSYKAMAALAREQPELQLAAAEAEFQDLGPLPQVTEEVQVNADGTAVERFRVQSAEDFSSGPPMEWVVRDVLPRAELCVIYGESGSGKSFLALDLAGAVTRGISWRNRRVVPGRVVYVCAEGAGGFKARLRAYAAGHNCELRTLPAVIPDTPNFLEPQDAAALAHGILQWGRPDVVIVDTLSAVAPGGNENSGEDMGQIVAHCKFLHKNTGALVVLIHHSGKDATKGARGWSGLRAAADAEIEVTRNGEYRTAAVTKMKDGGDGERWPFKLRVVPLGFDPEGDEESSCVIEHTEESAPRGSKAKPRGSRQIVLYKVMQELAAGGGAVDWAVVQEKTAERLGPPAEGERDRRPEGIAIARDGLVALDLLYVDGQKVSLTPIKQGGETEWLG